MAEERGLAVDNDGFDAALAEQRARSSEKAKFYTNIETPWTILREGQAGDFVGYTSSSADRR